MRNSETTAAAQDEVSEAPTVENKVILGSTTDLSGDFRYPGWGGSSAGSADIDINNLT